MLNEQRIILMTKLASYEAKEGKKSRKIANYFRSDYLSIQVLKAIVAATIVFGLVFGLYIFSDFEEFMQDIYKIDLVSFAKNILFYYVVFVIGYGVVCYLAGWYRYIMAKKSLKLFYQNLKRLYKMYKKK